MDEKMSFDSCPDRFNQPSDAKDAHHSFEVVNNLGLGDLRRRPIRRIHLRKIAVNALLDLLHARLDLALGEVAVAAIHSFKFASVDGDGQLGEKIEVAAKHYELPAVATSGFTIVSAKVSNCFEIGNQSAVISKYFQRKPLSSL